MSFRPRNEKADDRDFDVLEIVLCDEGAIRDENLLKIEAPEEG